MRTEIKASFSLLLMLIAAALISTPVWAICGKMSCACPLCGSSSGGTSRTTHFNSRPTYTPNPAPQFHLMSPEELNADLATTANDDGVALFRSGDLDGARSKFRHALELNPRDRIAQRNLAHADAELAFRANDYTRAISRIRDAIDLGRDDLRDRLAYFEREQRLEQAHDLNSDAVKLFGGGDLTKALPLFQKAANLAP